MISRKTLLLSAAALTVTGFAAPALAGPALQAAMLPSSRSSSLNRPVTVFASMINGGDAIAKGCSASLRNKTLPLTLSYQAMQADNATPAGAADTPFDLAPGAAQAMVLTFTPSAPIAASSVRVDYSCADTAGNTVAAPVVDGVNALEFSASATEAPDVVTIAQTRSGDGYIRIPEAGGAEAMAVSAVNIGAANNGNAADADLIAMPDTGNADLPVNLFVCETDAATGACLSNPAPFVHTNLGGAPKTYTVFANADPDAGIPDFPDISRVYLRFFETSSAQDDVRGEGRGATGLAVTAPAPASAGSAQSSALPEGVWEARFSGANGSYHEGMLFVSAAGDLNGIVYGDRDGEHSGNGDNNGNHNGDANDGDGDGDRNGDTDGDGDGQNSGNGDNNGDHNGDANDGDNDGDRNGDTDGDRDGNNGDNNGDGGDGGHDRGDDNPQQAGDSSSQRFASASLMAGSISTDAANNWSANAQVLDLGTNTGGVNYQLGGTFNAHNSLSGTYVPATGASVSVIGNGSLRAAFSRDYDRAVSLANLGGTFDFYAGRSDIGDLTVSNSGQFSGVYTAPGATQACDVSGDFADNASRANLFTVHITLRNCPAAGSYAGAATLRSGEDDRSAAVNPILGMAMTADSNAGFILDLFPRGSRPRNDR